MCNIFYYNNGLGCIMLICFCVMLYKMQVRSCKPIRFTLADSVIPANGELGFSSGPEHNQADNLPCGQALCTRNYVFIQLIR